ncbi:hypothetical protein GCK72_003446 [Caenorhabditis remanei]|uniref:Sdz-33 F-box domain-containing protein n=1 Tax=Caenorhabditis remanei TaxID=31234 RepID=A0A6A5HUZ5_CAERE|nr:hypothetical protein GCK72_003446 [Caenorhabditis remanei]KAF1771619.1 hypothetical protein GCK72_003446 [Caenorhabditis remanei]
MSRRPPRKFPLFRLPRLALIEVVKCWNPIEIYLFSRVSRMTKEISKLIKIPNLRLHLALYKYYENLKKDIGVLNLPHNYYETERSMTVRENEIMLKVNGKVDDLRFQSSEKFMDLDHLIRMDCVYMSGGETFLTNRDLNVFMKNWKEMKANERMGLYFFYAAEKLNWRVILEGLDGEIRDVRTVRREYTSPWNGTQIFKVNGGVDITRTDGKVATIGMTFHMIFQDEPLSREMIRDYQRLIQNMDEQEMDMNFVHDPEYKLTAEQRKAFFVMVK